jgi:cell division protein FtsB
MSGQFRRPALGTLVYLSLMAAVGLYFVFAAVQGSNGIFARASVEAEIVQRRAERDRLALERAALENRNRRLSDTGMDLDLLDERARAVLGLMRPDEIVLR